jgi:hypothetical protein
LAGQLNALNITFATNPSPSIPLPQGEREAKPLSFDGGVAYVQRGWREGVGQIVTIFDY